MRRDRMIAPRDLIDAASWLGLDTTQFAADLLQHRFAPRAREDFMSGLRRGVNGPPTFFINGVRHDGEWVYASLLDAVRRAVRVRA